MTLSTDLVALSRELAGMGAGKPKQAVLRRAVSTAYYAVFHFLVEQATRHVAGTGSDKAALRGFLARGVSHQGAKALCKEVSQGRWPSVVEKRIGPRVIPPPSDSALIRVSGAFVTLQEERHRADYDTVKRFTRARVIIEVARAEAVFDDWKRVTTGIGQDFFLYMLVTDSGGSKF